MMFMSWARTARMSLTFATDRRSRAGSGRRRAAICVAFLLAVATLPAQARLTTLHSFTADQGARPQVPLIEGSDGAFYGTTPEGGSDGKGTVFRIRADGTLITLVSFNGSNGSKPNGLIQGTDGAFYGTTFAGGTGDYGTVFRLSANGTLTTVVHFDGSRGRNPLGNLVQASDGTLYGTTTKGGSKDHGTIFRLSLAGTLTTLASFDGQDGRTFPISLIQGGDGAFYGLTRYNGSAFYYNGRIESTYDGAAFRLDANGALTTLAIFANHDTPSSLILGSDGALYGTTEQGGNNGNGSVFRLNPDGTLTTVVNFSGSSGGYHPTSLIQGSDGFFYGTTSGSIVSDSGGGTVFRLSPGGTLTTLAQFEGSNGSAPRAALIQSRGGALYGTTVYGGAELRFGDPYRFHGTVFRLTTGGMLTTLARFRFESGSTPNKLIQTDDGAFYGVATGGGSDYAGTVFHMSPGGTLTPRASFDSSNGRLPVSLVQGSDGTIYGITQLGGTYDLGTVFRMDPDGTLSTLVSFDGYNGNQPTSLIHGNDGALYGTTRYGGMAPAGSSSRGHGTVFRLSPNGTLTTLANFDGSTGSNPTSLIQASDGAFYGTAASGGSNGDGTVFRMSADGILTTLTNFKANHGDQGGYPDCLIQGSDGAFYGVIHSASHITDDGYLSHGHDGAVFRLSPNGTLTWLAQFNSYIGADPTALIQGSDGAFYGTTRYDRFTFAGSGVGYGTVFRISQGSTLTTLVSFTGENGSLPTSLIQGSDGAFYGTTSYGGVSNAGTLFRLDSELGISVSPTSIPFGAIVVGQASTSQAVQIRNTSSSNLQVGTPTINGSSDFAIVGNTCLAAVAPGASCTISVRFTPSNVIARSAGLVIPSNASGSPNKVGLNGEGIAGIPQTSVTPAKIAFGSVPVGQSLPAQVVTVANAGNGNLHVGTPTINGSSDLAIVGNTCTIAVAPGASCAISVRFTPSKVIARSAALIIPSDAPDSPNKVGLSGEGTAVATELEVIPTLAVRLNPLALGLQLTPKAQLREVDSDVPVAGKTVRFRTLEGSLLNPDAPLDLCVAQTDSLGYATCQTLLSTIEALLYLDIVASFAGDAIYLPSEDDGRMIMIGTTGP